LLLFVFTVLHTFGRLKKICPASFRETCQWLKFPLNGLRAQSRVRPVVGLLPLAFDNKLNNFLKITGILNNVFRPQNILRKQQ